MPRDYRLYFEDVLEAIEKIQKYVLGFSFSDFQTDLKTVDAVIRNLEVIGEAIKKVPAGIRKKHPHVEWRKIGGLRDILIHEYSRIDEEIIWDVVQNKLPILNKQIQDIIDSDFPPK